MSFFANLKISRKLATAFACLIVITLGVSGLIYSRVVFIQQSAHWTEHTYQVLEGLQQVMEGMVDQETGLRGYLLSGDQNFLAPYKSGKGMFDEAFARVQQLTSDNPLEQQRLSQIQDLAQKWHDQVAGQEISLMAPTASQDQARKMEASGIGKKSMDGIRQIITEMDKTERGLKEKRDADEASAFHMAYTLTLAGGVVSLLTAIGFGVLLTRGIAGPITRMTGSMKRLAEGDKTVAISGIGRKDEIGAMAEAVQVFKDTAIEAERLSAAQAEEQASRERRAQRLEELTRGFETKVGNLVQSLSSAASEMEATAQAMSSTAEQTNHQSIAVAAASEQASANVQTVATATEELASSIKEIGRQVTQSSQIAAKAVGEATRTDATVQALATGAQRVGEVASEGKSLASQTAKATEEIAVQIAQIQDATKGAVATIQSIGTTITEINEIAAAIASAVEEQMAATQEIARNVQQAAKGTQEVSSNIAGVKQAATDTGAAASQVLGSAGELSRHSHELSREVDAFLSGVKAA